MSERDLAEAIYQEITSQRSVIDALDAFHESLDWNERQRMWFALSYTTLSAIEKVLAGRLREAARAGPWDWGDYQEEDGYPGSLLPRKRGDP